MAAATQPSTAEEIIKATNTNDWDAIKSGFWREMLEWMKSARHLSDDVIAAGKEGAGAAKGFLVEQVPLVIQEIVKWGFVYYTFWAVFCLAVVSLGIYWSRKAKNITWKKIEYSEWAGPFFAKISGFIVGVVGFCCLMYNLYMIAFIYFSPRLYIIQQLTKMVQAATGK